MTSNAAPHPPDNGPSVPSVAQLAESLAALDGQLHAVHQATVELVRRVGEVVGSGIVERVEGLPLEAWLGLRARMIGADRHTLVTTAEVMATMPITAAMFASGELSFGIVRTIARWLCRRSLADRHAIDDRIGRAAELWGGVDVYAPDRLLSAIERAVHELDDPTEKELAEAAGERASYVAVQPSFDGRVSGGFDLDPLRGATFLTALDAASPAGPVRTRPARRADGLTRLSEAYLAGARGRRPRPSLLVTVDLSRITATDAGTLDLQVPCGVAPVLSARVVDALAADADVRAVVCDGARPLTVTARRRADHLPGDVRAAVRARDVVDRFPGSDRPLQHIHHTVERRRGGDHHVDRLVGLSDRSHGIVHDHDWVVRHDAATGIVTIRRNGVTWRSIPQTTPLPPTGRAPHAEPAPWLASGGGPSGVDPPGASPAGIDGSDADSSYHRVPEHPSRRGDPGT